MNLNPEELRKLQILNDYVTQSMDVLQRNNPMVAQRAFQPAWQQGIPQTMQGPLSPYAPYGTMAFPNVYPQAIDQGLMHATAIPQPIGATPWANIPGTVGGLQHTPYQPNPTFLNPQFPNMGIPQPINYDVRGLQNPIQPYPYATGLQHTGYDVRALQNPYTPYQPNPYVTGLQHTGYDVRALQNPWDNPFLRAINPMMQMPYGLQHTGYDVRAQQNPYTPFMTQQPVGYDVRALQNPYTPFMTQQPVGYDVRGMQNPWDTTFPRAINPMMQMPFGLQHTTYDVRAQQNPWDTTFPRVTLNPMQNPYIGLQHTAFDPERQNVLDPRLQVQPWAAINPQIDPYRAEMLRRVQIPVVGFGC